MSIYFITDGINRMAGTERVIVQLAKAFNNVIILVPGTTQCAFSEYQNLNIHSVGIGDFPENNKLLKIYHRFSYYEKLKKIINNDIDATVVSFSFDLNLINITLSKRLKYKPIVCEHIEYNYHSGFRNLIRKKVYKQEGVKLVCLTETDKKKFESDGIKTYVIPNFIYPLNVKYSEFSRKIVSIGRLEYQKNFNFLIEAFSKSKIYEHGWSLHIVGEGSEKSELESKIKILNMNNFIHIHNFTNEIQNFYSSAGLICMTSRFEAFPMVLLEALNNSLPVLITDFPTGAREILGEDNVQIIQHYETKAFADALEKFCLCDNLRKKLSSDNSKLIKKYYPEQIIKTWKLLIDES